MARVKHSPASRLRHKRVLKQAKGAWLKRSKNFRKALETVRRGMVFAYRDRKARKRTFRQLWITRIQAACKSEGITYSRFMNGLKRASVPINRKVLSEIAQRDEKGFQDLVKVSKETN